MKSTWKYFTSSFVVTFVGLFLAGVVGYYYSGNLNGAWTSVFIAAILSLLEVSISFDNAVVNATVLKDMNETWKHRFITWGMLIAVFGMRLVFPLLIVEVVAGLGPIEAIKLATFQPDEYAKLMLSVHHEVAAFGGAFLMLVALKYFFNHEKDNHWIRIIEEPLAKMGRLEAIEVGLTIITIMVFSRYLPQEHQVPFIFSGLGGILTFLGVEAIGTFLQLPQEGTVDAARAGLSMFIYLEVLDASFSFDGVIGAFAITNNLFIIAIGLGIGAMFVRSLTILMVEKGTLTEFKYLEHGAFYAVASLAVIMFLDVVIHVPEIVTGFVSAVFIAYSFWDSVQYRKKHGH